MDKKRSLLTDSAGSCGWLIIGMAASIFVIFMAGASQQYPAFYSSAAIQILNCFAMYLGVTRKTHQTFIFVVASFIKIVIAGIGFFCLAYFYLLANKPDANVDAYRMYTFLLTAKATYIVSGLFLLPLIECIVEYIVHVVLTPTDNP